MCKESDYEYESEGKIKEFDTEVNKIWFCIESKTFDYNTVRTPKNTLFSSLTALFIVLPIRAILTRN